MIKLIIKLLLISALLVTAVHARELTFESIHSMPKSTEKDYYIWRYISADSTSKSDALSLIKEAKRINGKLAKSYKNKTGLKAPTHHKAVKKQTPEQIAEQKRRISITKEILKSPNPYPEWLKLSSYMKVFVLNNAGESGRAQLDHPLTPEIYSKLTEQYGFNKLIRKIQKEKPKHFTQALLYPISEKNRLSFDSISRLAFNALYRGKSKIAEIYFARIATNSEKREVVDKSLFWAFISSRNKEYLKKLTKSYDINLYTLLARDILRLRYPSTITPVLPEGKLLGVQISDPIKWANLRKKVSSKNTDLKKLAKKYGYSDAVGYYSYIMSRASRDTEQYFPMPYRDILSKLPKNRQAILYAIARQESRFVPASISTSYALGMMQFMPFLVRHIAKLRKEKVNYDSMFNPRKAIIYANEHMNYLTKWLQHPLFIAYAYNAGIGYTRKMIRKKHLFNGKGSLEPYLSLELVDNTQARIYGKHVLVNYVIYMNKLGVPLRVIDLLKLLHIPEKTDKFRKRKK